MAYARQLRTPTIYRCDRASRGHSARSPVSAFPPVVCRHFDRLKELPAWVASVWRCICRFNPVYGQGMSVAAQEACLLSELLRRRAEEDDPLAGLASAFFAEAARLIETPWALAAIPDYAVPETEGQRPADLKETLEFGQGLIKLAATDAAVHKLWVEVLHLLKPRSVLNNPDLVERVKALKSSSLALKER